MDVPYLRPSDIENAATNLLCRYEAYASPINIPPVPIDEICEDFLKIDIVPGVFENDFPEKQLRGALGALDINDKAIYVDETKNNTTGRFRFTVAHEIGHHELHCPLLTASTAQQELFTGAGDNKVIVCRQEQSRQPIEWQANQFAACLMMPKRLLIPFVVRIREIGHLSSFQPTLSQDADCQEDIISTIATWFEVSKIAARIRLQDLRIIPKTKIQVA